MRIVQASEARAHLPQLLSDVGRGHRFTITRHGQPIAQLIPVVEPHRVEIEKVMEQIAAFRETMPRIPLADILSSRHEGHHR